MNHQLDKILILIESENHPFTAEEIKKSQGDFSIINKEDQSIRIIDKKGNVVLHVSDDLNEIKIPPFHVYSKQFEISKSNHDPLLILRAPIATDNFIGTIEIIRSMEMMDDFVDNIFWVLIIGSAGGLLLSFLGGTFLSRQLLSSVRVLTDTMQKIKVNGLKERVPVYETNDEIARIGRLFNELMDDLEKSFSQQKQFVEDASHELRTPLAIIHGHLSLLNRWGKDDPVVLNKSLHSSLKETDRLIKLVQELLELSKAETKDFSEVKPVPVTPIIQSVKYNFELLHPDFIFKTQICEETPYVAIPARYLEQILIILLDNAIKFSAEKKEITIACFLHNETVHIQVIDKGIGMSEQDMPYVLNRFYRADKARSSKKGGQGLGLAIAKRHLEKYKGTISIESKEGKGTTFTITFPVVKPPF